MSSTLLILAFVCFALAAWIQQQPIWNRLVAVGLAAVAIALFLAGGGFR